MNTSTDPKDLEILAERLAAYNAREGMTVGDVIRFNDGKIMRIAHIHRDAAGNPKSIQPAWGGSFYMFTHGGCEMSGSLESGLDPALFEATNERAQAVMWFFHHGMAGAGRGREFEYAARVWHVNTKSPRKYSETYYLAQVSSEYARNETCGNYHYIITKGSTNHTAFQHESDFLNWLDANGLRLSEPLAPRGEFKSQRLEKIGE